MRTAVTYVIVALRPRLFLRGRSPPPCQVVPRSPAVTLRVSGTPERNLAGAHDARPSIPV